MHYVVSYEYKDGNGGERKETFYSLTYVLSFIEHLLKDQTKPIKYVRISVRPI